MHYLHVHRYSLVLMHVFHYTDNSGRFSSRCREQDRAKQCRRKGNIHGCVCMCVFTYLWIDGECLMGFAHTQQVIDDLFHGKVKPFLQKETWHKELFVKSQKLL